MSNAGPQQPNAEQRIDPEGWRRAKELFSSLCEVTPQERSGVLDRFHEDDPIRIAAVRLLRSLDSASGFLEDPPSRVLDFPDAPVMLPERIGTYTPLERLGEGGFGIVYRARQTHPVEREVAVKVLRVGPESPQVLARFADERRFLARLDHPDVVRVLDAGTTEEGRLFVVMDLVIGKPITAFVHQTEMSMEARLRLFARVCRAVHAVHQRGVIHRDLKPSNIVVSDESDGPRPRIIDFGIAAALDTSEHSGWTRVGTPIGTPKYASPEQAAGTIGIDTRTDIYALGVILAEMLTGSTPRAGAIGNETPAVPPSRLAREAGDAGLSRRLRGDLDRVVLKAVAWDRSRRYDSAAALADDVERQLAGLPVAAAGPGAAYIACKFIARHRVSTAAGSFAVLALIAGLLVSLGATHQAKVQRRIAESNAQRAAFIGSLLLKTIERNADPDAASGQVVLDESDLDALTSEAIAGLTDDPWTMLDLLETIARIRLKLGHFARASELFRIALDHSSRLAPEPNERGVRLMVWLALALATQHAEPELVTQLRQRALRDAEQIFDPHDARLLSIRILNPIELEELHRVVAMLDADPEANPRDVIAGLLSIMWRIESGPSPADALPHARHAYERSVALLGPGHSTALATMMSYASAESHYGSPEIAIGLLLDGLERCETTFGPDHYYTESTLRLLSRVYGDADQSLLGIPHAEIYEALTRRLHGAGSVQHIGALRMLGMLYADAGDLWRARRTLQDAVEAASRQWSRTNPALTSAEARLAEVLVRLGELEAGNAIATRALADMPIESMAEPVAFAVRARVVALLAWDELDAATDLMAATLARFEAAGVTGRAIEILTREIEP